MSDPRIPESKTSEDGNRVDVFDGPRDDHDTHSVINTSEQGLTTHDYERIADDNGNKQEVVDEDTGRGNVIAVSDDPSDESYDAAERDAALNDIPTDER